MKLFQIENKSFSFIFKLDSLSNKTEGVFAKTEMNNKWNLQNSSFQIYHTYANDFFPSPLVEAPLELTFWYYLPTTPLGQDMTQGQFLSGV